MFQRMVAWGVGGIGLLWLTLGAADPKADGDWQKKPGLYAILETTKGQIVCELFEKQAPKTVANFVGLAKGTKEWTDPRTGKKVKRPFYNGLLFHRHPEFYDPGRLSAGQWHGRTRLQI